MHVIRWQCLKISMLLLGTSVAISWAPGSFSNASEASPTNRVSHAQHQVDLKRVVAFSIDTDEVEGATTIWADLFGVRTALQGKDSGVYALPYPLSLDNPIVIVSVSGPNVGIVGEDVLIWKRKETLVFNAHNNARSAVIFGLIQFGASNNQLIHAYTNIGGHAKFPELRQIFLAEKGHPASDAILDSIAEMTFEIAVDILEELEIVTEL
jgi:hypothetical protein